MLEKRKKREKRRFPPPPWPCSLSLSDSLLSFSFRAPRSSAPPRGAQARSLALFKHSQHVPRVRSQDCAACAGHDGDGSGSSGAGKERGIFPLPQWNFFARKRRRRRASFCSPSAREDVDKLRFLWPDCCAAKGSRPARTKRRRASLAWPAKGVLQRRPRKSNARAVSHPFFFSFLLLLRFFALVRVSLCGLALSPLSAPLRRSLCGLLKGEENVTRRSAGAHEKLALMNSLDKKKTGSVRRRRLLLRTLVVVVPPRLGLGLGLGHVRRPVLEGLCCRGVDNRPDVGDRARHGN